ncbi:MAG: NADH-quinone oxidoreductase subunit N [Actinomycetota bacterium]|nr:NADH-quinone oxidoreductase subunit N [Actinomycetota bacterium]
MNPVFDWHALAPDVILVATIVVVLVVEFAFPRQSRTQTSRIAAIGVLAALVPIVSLATHENEAREMFAGAYAVDNYALALKAFFLVVTYITILLSVDYIDEGDYYRGEFYFLLLTSVLGLMVMASARDLITIFIALETISIPTFILAAFRKHDRQSNEAGVKYYLIGVLSSAIMLYGMSIIFGLTGTTTLSGISDAVAVDATTRPLLAVAMFLTLVGFAFKVSAVPFHFWAPDTYEGAPTPVTAFLSVASKAGGFVALLSIIFFGFRSPNAADLWWGPVWILAVLSMTLGNLAALRQTNIVRMLAYSSIAQGGFMLVPFAAAGIAEANGEPFVADTSFEAVVIYLLIYGAMNLGAFAVVIAVARRTRSAEISSYGGLFETSPVLAVTMTMFLASLAGIPPVAGWFAKFVMFRSALEAGGPWGVSLAVIAAVNSVIAFFYYAGVIRVMWFKEPVTEDRSPIQVPGALTGAIAITATVTFVIGVYPQLFARVGELAF